MLATAVVVLAGAEQVAQQRAEPMDGAAFMDFRNQFDLPVALVLAGGRRAAALLG